MTNFCNFYISARFQKLAPKNTQKLICRKLRCKSSPMQKNLNKEILNRCAWHHIPEVFISQTGLQQKSLYHRGIRRLIHTLPVFELCSHTFSVGANDFFFEG